MDFETISSQAYQRNKGDINTTFLSSILKTVPWNYVFTKICVISMKTKPSKTSEGFPLQMPASGIHLYIWTLLEDS